VGDVVEGPTPGAWSPFSIDWDSALVRYVVCQLERATTTGREHWQGYIQLLSPCGINRVKGALGCSSAHLEPTRGTPSEAIAYCKKQDTAVIDEGTGGHIIFEWGQPVLGPEVSRINKDEAYRKVLEASTKEEAMALFMELCPKDYVVYHQQMRRVLDEKFGKRLPRIRPIATFKRDPIDTDILDKYSVVLSGMSGSGKTAFALAHFKKPLLVRHIDQLKNFSPADHDGLVFDDMSFNHWPAEANIHLFDLENDSHINCRYATGFIPSGFHRIFTTNKPLVDFIAKDISCDDQKEGITRRLCFITIDESMF